MQNKLKRAEPCLLLAGLLAALAAQLCYWRFLGPAYLDADMASEQLLARQLATQPGLPVLSDSWYYSTELRVLNTQLVMASLFRLFPSLSWHAVRVAGSLALVLIYLASYLYFARRAGLRAGGLYGCLLLLLPLGPLYRQYVLDGLYYIPHLAISFASLGCGFRLLGGKGRRWPAAAALCLLAFAAGLGGPRQLMILNLPLTLAALLLLWLDRPAHERNAALPAVLRGWLRRPCAALLAASLAADLCGAAGYLINEGLLARRYSFFSQSYLSFSGVSAQRLEWLITALLASFGWQQGAVFSLTSLFNLAVLAAVAFTFWFAWRLLRGRAYPPAHRLLGAFTLCLALCFLALYALTNSGHSDRYLLPLGVLAIPLWECWLTDCRPRLPRASAQACGLAALAVLALGAGQLGRTAASLVSRPSDNLATAQYLAAQGYTNGYATFWDGNILTELSNGQLEVWSLSPYNSWEIMQWLQDRRHLAEPPQGPVFLVLSKWESEGERTASPAAMRDAVPDTALVYENDSHLVYAFASDADLRRQCHLPPFNN